MTERNQFTASQLEWLTALESGEFKQGFGKLASKHGHSELFCCLGVRCRQMKLKEAWRQGIAEFGESGVSCMAPNEVVEDLQLYSSYGGGLRDTDHSLASLNDGLRLIFRNIAAIIREAPWIYFKNFDPPAGSPS